MRWALVLAAFTLHTGTAHAALSKRVVAFWQKVQRCEEPITGWSTRGSTYSGGVGFYNATWSKWATELGLGARYPNAADAPMLVQIRVADYGYRVHHGYWGTIADGCSGPYPG